MQRLRDNAAGSNQKQTNPQESRRLAIGRCIRSLEHACQCRDADCSLPSCRKIKRVVSHAKACKRKSNGDCSICKQLIALVCYHSKNCQETICPVPFCLNIKNKLIEKQRIMKSRSATTHNRGMAEAIGQLSPGSSNQPSLDNEPLASPEVPQPGLLTTLLASQVLQQLRALTPLRSVNFSQRKQQFLNIRHNPTYYAIKQRLRQVGPQQQEVMDEATVIGQPQFQPGSPQGRAWQQHRQLMAKLRQQMLAKLRQQLGQLVMSPMPAHEHPPLN